MAVTITTVTDAFHLHIADVEATADADTGATIPHTLAVPPRVVTLVPLQAAFYTSQWRVTSIDATNIVIEKGTAAGSGAAGDQVRVQAARDVMAPRAP